MSPGAVTAPHSHTHEEETPYVLEGTLQVETQGKTITLTAGQTATLPRNVPHRLSNPTSGITRILMLCKPAGFDSYLKEIGEPVDDPTAPPAPMTEAQISRLVEVAGRYGISMVDQAEL